VKGGRLPTNLLYQTTMATNQLTASIKVTHNDDAINASTYLGRADLQLFTIKGRLEYSKDYKGVLAAALDTLGIERIDYDWIDSGTVTLSWVIGGVGKSDYNKSAYDPVNRCRIDQVQEYVDTFIANLIKVQRNIDSIPALSGLGIELHVFIQSLKPVEDYDGERDGPLEDLA
jgi:hypothetical protein